MAANLSVGRGSAMQSSYQRSGPFLLKISRSSIAICRYIRATGATDRGEVGRQVTCPSSALIVVWCRISEAPDASMASKIAIGQRVPCVSLCWRRVLSDSNDPLPVYEILKLSRVSVALNLDCRDDIVNCFHIFRRQFHLCGCKIFLQAMQFCGSRNGYDPWLPGKQP